MPIGIFLYEIEKSFGPQLIADYYVTKEKATPEILKVFNEKHVKKGLSDATHQKNEILYYSSVMNIESVKKNLYLGFVIRETEDLVSLKSLFESIEEKVSANYSKDKNKMKLLLKDILKSMISLFEKLKEPAIIQDTINERTKLLLDQGKLQEARKLIELIDTKKIPQKLSREVKLAENLMKQAEYRKARKSYLKAADFAKLIKEVEIQNLLKKKAEHVGSLPDLLKTRDAINKGMKKSLEDLMDVQVEINIYENLIPLIEKNIQLSNSLEDHEQIEILEDLKKNASQASKKAKELKNVDDKVIDYLKQLFK